MKNVVIISSSLRPNSNSEILAKSCEKGLLETNNKVEFITLKNKNIQFCKGCLSCIKTGKCFINDDVKDIINKAKEADVIIFASPVYYYGISGQLKTLLDRLNPLYDIDYKFKDIYLIATAAEDAPHTFDKSYECLLGWVDCFPKATLKRIIKAGGVTDPNEINKFKDKLLEAYNLGKNI